MFPKYKTIELPDTNFLTYEVLEGPYTGTQYCYGKVTLVPTGNQLGGALEDCKLKFTFQITHLEYNGEGEADYEVFERECAAPILFDFIANDDDLVPDMKEA